MKKFIIIYENTGCKLFLMAEQKCTKVTGFLVVLSEESLFSVHSGQLSAHKDSGCIIKKSIKWIP